MKIKLVLTSDSDQAIWANAERAAKRVQQWPAWKRGGMREDFTAATVDADASSPSESTVDKE
jgi:hypothetical protein